MTNASCVLNKSSILFVVKKNFSFKEDVH
jgi:hypothetical protein